jgi:hypothetical protein
MKTQFTNDQINAVMEKRGCTRKAALRWLNRNREDRPKGKAAAAPAKDVKKAAANDNTEAVPAEPKSEAGAARSEGLRLYKLAGRPTKAQFIKVYGKRGHLMTWDQRAEAGVPAAKFQAALAEKQGK